MEGPSPCSTNKDSQAPNTNNVANVGSSRTLETLEVQDDDETVVFGRKRNPVSEVWKHFKLVEVDGKYKANCNYCNKSLVAERNKRKNSIFSNVMVLPLFKLGTLALRMLSKSIAKRLKQQTVHHPRFCQFIIGITQANHRFTTTLQRHTYNHAKDIEILPLNEERAVQAASNMLGEMFAFLVAGALVVFEVQRSAKSEAKKEEKRKQELEELRKRDEALSKEVELLRLKIAELEQLSKGRGIPRLSNFKFSKNMSSTERS